MSIAVVTGAGRGIGRAIAARLARDGFDMVCVDRDQDAAKEVAREVGGRPFAADVRDEDAAAELAASLDDCAALVNNAGMWRFTRIADTSISDAEEVFGVNVTGTLVWLKALHPVMARSGGGSVVNMASMTAKATPTGAGMYPPAKAAVISLTKMAALEYAKDGIRVNVVAPGMIVTEGTIATYGETEEAQADRGGIVPLGRLGKPEDIAGAASYLCSPDASYVTGQTLLIDGGFTEATNDFYRAARGATASADRKS